MVSEKHLLMAAWGISPRWGSEEAVGWNWLVNVPSGWSTTLLTGRRGDEQIQWGIDHGQRAPSLIAVEKPRGAWSLRPGRHPLASRLEMWLAYTTDLRLFSLHFQELLRSRRFDLIHQTTIASWRCAMPFHSMGIPTVWGPIGGAEPFPWKYAFQTSFQNCLFEAGRLLTDNVARRRKAVIDAVKSVDVIIVTNKQTETFLRSLGRSKPILRRPMVISQERFTTIRCNAGIKDHHRLNIISGGTVEGRKGFALTIQAVSKLKQRGIPVQFVITGRGVEIPKLRKLSIRCGVGDEVVFATHLDADNYIKQLNASHIFCFPSLRDNSPVTLLEAMAAGCVPIVLDNGGPAGVVTPDCGVVLPLETPLLTVARLEKVLSDLWNGKQTLASMARNSIVEVERNYLESCISQTLADAYALAAEVAKTKPPHKD